MKEKLITADMLHDDGFMIIPDWEIEDHFDQLITILHRLERREDDFRSPHREGLRETPKRVAKAWCEWFGGYNIDPVALLRTFEDGAEDYDEMVTVNNIPFYSHCEHHVAPFFGVATVSYIPDGRVVGLSKLNRLVDCFARRLQVQERLTRQVAQSLMDSLKPKGVGVQLRARHLCMESRGICQQGHTTTTTALQGCMRTESRDEFLEACRC